jgi:hypothetical protein
MIPLDLSPLRSVLHLKSYATPDKTSRAVCKKLIR